MKHKFILDYKKNFENSHCHCTAIHGFAPLCQQIIPGSNNRYCALPFKRTSRHCPDVSQTTLGTGQLVYLTSSSSVCKKAAGMYMGAVDLYNFYEFKSNINKNQELV